MPAGSRFSAVESNATLVPSADREGEWLSPLPLIPSSEVEAKMRSPGTASAKGPAVSNPVSARTATKHRPTDERMVSVARA